MSDHNKCPSSEKEPEKCIFRLSYFHRIEPTYLHLVREGAGIVANGMKFSTFAQRDPHLAASEGSPVRAAWCRLHRPSMSHRAGAVARGRVS